MLVATLAFLFARATALNHDEFFFLDAAKNLAVHGRYATVSNGQAVMFDPYLSTGPTVIGPIALMFWAWGPGYFVARLVMVAFFIALFVLLYRVTSALHGRAAAWVACAFALSVPLVWFMGLHVLGEIPAVVLCLAGVHCLLQAQRSPSGTRDYLLAGLFLGLAALTKLIFFLAVAALGGVALLAAVRDRRRARALAGGVAGALAILASWELVQLLVVGPEAYRELKQVFSDMFARESGMKVSLEARSPLAEALVSARLNFWVLEHAGRGWALTTLALIVVVIVGVCRKITARQDPIVHVFLGLFLGSYVAWFFFVRHEPFYRLLLPAYFLAGIYVASVLVDTAGAFARVGGFGRKLAVGTAAGIAVIALFVVPFARNAESFVRTCREQQAWRNLSLIAAMKEQIPADAKIGYWGWWRAPEVSFFLPNQFLDISQPEQRRRFAPDRDFILAMATQRRFDPRSWEQQQRYCREEVVVRGRNTLCRFGRGLVQAPVAPSARLDFMSQAPVREDQLTDGFYQTVGPAPRWVASSARFFIGTSGKDGRLRLQFEVPTFLSPTASDPVTVDVTVNDAVLARLQFNTAGPKTVTTDCVPSDSTTDAARVELTTNRSFVPKKLKINEDRRVLALQLRDVEFQPEQACGVSRRSR